MPAMPRVLGLRTASSSLLRPALVAPKLQLRYNSNPTPSYQPPNPPSQEPQDPRGSAAKPHRAFYSNFGLPLFKTFLIALFTYQVMYWGWLKLESLETKREKDAELKSLEDKVKQMVGAKKLGS